MTPTERDNQFVVFDAATASLAARRRRRRQDLSREQRQHRAAPRAGVDARRRRPHRGARRLRVGGRSAGHHRGQRHGRQPAVCDAADRDRSDSAERRRQPHAADRPCAGDRRSAVPQRLAALVERQRAAPAGAATSPRPSVYFGSRGADLRISRNLNQPVNGVRPFPALSAASPIRPGATLGTITQVESTGFSSYHALSLTATKRLSRGLLFDTSYTWSKSLDTNSLNSSNFNVQDGYDIPNQYGLSDFDARHRFVLSATYQLPFNGSAWTRDWQIATIVQSQSGNPVNIVTSNATLNGVPNTVRPDLVAPIRIIGSVDQWFDPGVVRGGESLRQPRTQRRDRPGIPQHRSVGQQGPHDREPLPCCSCAPMRSICSTIRTSVRPATSSAVRPSARSPEPACRPAKPVRRARFNWRRSCRSDARRTGARVRCSWPRRSSTVASRPARGRAAPDQARADRFMAARRHSRATRDSTRSLTKVLFSHPTIEVDVLRRVPGERRIRRERRTPRCATPSASSSAIVRSTLLIANAAPALQFALRHRDELFPNVPIVFVAATPPREVLAGQGRAASPASCANPRRSKRWTWR